MLKDRFENAVGIFKNLVIPKSNNFKSLSFKVFGAEPVFWFLDRMLTPVKLDDEFSFKAAEIAI